MLEKVKSQPETLRRSPWLLTKWITEISDRNQVQRGPPYENRVGHRRVRRLFPEKLNSLSSKDFGKKKTICTKQIVGELWISGLTNVSNDD